MRVGIDATALPAQPGGAGIYTIQLIRALKSLNESIDLVVFAHDFGADLINTTETDSFQFVRIPRKSPARRLIWEQTVFSRQVRNSGIDLLHSLHYTRPRSLSCASVVTYHDMTFFLYPQYHTLFKRYFFSRAIRYSARKADAIIAVSNNTRRDAIRLLGLPENKITAIPLGVSSEYRVISDEEHLEKIRNKYKLPQEFILYVGVVEPRKNVTLLLCAFSKLLREDLDQKLVIAGQLGWMYENVFEQAEKLGIEDQVIFPGYIPSGDLPGLYNLASIFVYPSIYEGFGLPPLEAMACGIPTITTRISSMPENVGEAALLVPPQDEEALAGAIRSLINDPQRQQQLSKMGVQRASTFTWEDTARATAGIYQQVLKAK